MVKGGHDSYGIRVLIHAWCGCFIFTCQLCFHTNLYIDKWMCHVCSLICVICHQLSSFFYFFLFCLPVFGEIKICIKKTAPSPVDKNCTFSELSAYFTIKFCTIVFKGWLHYCYTFYKNSINLYSTFSNATKPYPRCRPPTRSQPQSTAPTPLQLMCI